MEQEKVTAQVPTNITGVKPGDVIAVRSPGIFGQLIRLGSAIHDEAELDNHIAVFHHIDGAGIPWAIEAKPGGVGWRDARDYLNNGYTITNRNQPNRDPNARNQICAIMEAMLHTPYDWPAIAQDALNDLRLPDIWKEAWGPQLQSPAHVVCSSLAAWGYLKVGWDHPQTADPAHVQPSDWLEFILNHRYN